MRETELGAKYDYPADLRVIRPPRVKRADRAHEEDSFIRGLAVVQTFSVVRRDGANATIIETYLTEQAAERRARGEYS